MFAASVTPVTTKLPSPAGPRPTVVVTDDEMVKVHDAVIVAFWLLATAPATAGKLPCTLPTGIVTVDGTARLVLLVARLIVAGLFDGLLSVTVHVVFCPDARSVLSQRTVATCN